jgi:hypothetical protein
MFRYRIVSFFKFNKVRIRQNKQMVLQISEIDSNIFPSKDFSYKKFVIQTKDNLICVFYIQ